MKSLTTDFSFLEPKILAKEESVNAWCTLKNAHHSSRESTIPGLNLGFNTPERREVIVQNRLAMLNALNINPQHIAYAEQVHGDSIQKVDRGGTYPSTDGFITKKIGLTLGIQVADCAAVLCWDAVSNVIGAFHAGWRGAAAGIVSKGLKQMIEEGAAPENMSIYVSPCICQKKFEIGKEVAEEFPTEFIDNDRFKKPHLDLKGFLRHQILSAGITESQIEISDGCTVEDAERFYSFRREGNQSGRMMALIRLAGVNSQLN